LSVAWSRIQTGALGLIAPIKSAALAFWSMSPAIGATTAALLASPITWIVAGIGVAVAGLALVIRKYWDPIAAYVGGVFEGIRSAMQPAIDSLSTALAPLAPIGTLVANVFGFIADAVGSAVAEALADRLHDHIEQTMAPRGWRITNRYSPGYCGWSVAEQHALFALLPAGFCGIALGESALMHPVKSVSGLIGVGAAVKHADYLCDVCTQRDCTYRRYHERRRARGVGGAAR
jgi:hypothetical protein